MLQNLKSYGRVLLAGGGFLYDLKRYWSYAGWKIRLGDAEERNYYMVKVYHALEKSMSFSERRPGAGWDNALLLMDALEKSANAQQHGCHDNMSLTVLEKFLEVEKPHNPEKCSQLAERIHSIKHHYSESDIELIDEPGVICFSREKVEHAQLKEPESFFLTRHSLREYAAEPVDESVLHRAVKLAMGTPSVCNRQAWHVYHLNGSMAQTALAEQNGNRGFGHKVEQVLIVAADLKAFCSPNERYQHWIDGGMFSMSLIWALHSLGVASCCLNWSQSGRADMRLRSAVPIKPEHTVMMMIAIGYPKESNTVCSSVRRPVEEVYTLIEKKEPAQNAAQGGQA